MPYDRRAIRREALRNINKVLNSVEEPLGHGYMTIPDKVYIITNSSGQPIEVTTSRDIAEVLAQGAHGNYKLVPFITIKDFE